MCTFLFRRNPISQVISLGLDTDISEQRESNWYRRQLTLRFAQYPLFHFQLFIGSGD